LFGVRSYGTALGRRLIVCRSDGIIGTVTDDDDRLRGDTRPPLGCDSWDGAELGLGLDGERGLAERTGAGRSDDPRSSDESGDGEGEGFDRERGPADRTEDGRSEASSGPDGRVTGFEGRPGEAAERLRATEERVSPPLAGGALAIEPPVAERADRGTA